MVIAAVSAIMAGAAWHLMRGPWDDPRRQMASAQGAGDAKAASGRGLGLFLALGFAMFVKYGPLMGFQGLWGVPYLTQVYQMTKVQAGNLLMWISIGYIVGGRSWACCRTVRPDLKVASDRHQRAVSGGVGPAGVHDRHGSFGTAVRHVPGHGDHRVWVGSGGPRASTRSSGAGHEGGGLGIVNGFSLLGGAVFQPLMGFMIDRFTSAGLAQVAAYARTFQMVSSSSSAWC